VSVNLAIVTSLLTELPLTSTLKVAHSVLDSLNRRRLPSRELLIRVDGPEEADRVADVATRIVRTIEDEEGRTLGELPDHLIQQYAEVISTVAGDRARRELPEVDESRRRTLLEGLGDPSMRIR
jgi:hypothetical protein